MSVIALRPSARERELAGTAPIQHWEYLVVALAFSLMISAVTPLVFNPSPGPQEALRDPLSGPLWLIVAAGLTIGSLRFLDEILRAILRNLPIAALCYLAGLSVIWSDVPRLTLVGAIQLTFITILGFYIGVRFGISGLLRVLSWVTAGALALSIAFIIAFPEYGIDALRSDAWRGVFGTKNELGRVMVLGLLVWLIRGLSRDARRYVAIPMVFGFAIVGYLSEARTALGVAGLTLGVLAMALALSRTGSRSISTKGLIVSLAGFLCLLTIFSFDLLLRLVGADYTLTGRTGIWRAVQPAMESHLLLGYGLDSFWRGIEGPSLSVWRASQTTPPHSHNGFFDLTLDLGIVGLALYALVLIIVWHRGLVYLREDPSAAGRVFPILFLSFVILYNLTESGLFGARSAQWVIVVAIAAALSSRSAHQP